MTVKIALAACGTYLAVAGFGATEIFVSPSGDDRNDGSAAKPVKTLQRALDRVRAVLRDEPKTIVVRDGVYPFEKPVCLTADDYDLTIRAEHGGKAVFSGAVKLTGWRKDDEDPKLLVADLPFLPKDGMRLALVSSGAWRPIAAYPDFPRGPVMKYVSSNDKAHMAYTEDMDFSGVDFTSAWLVIPQEWTTCVSYVKEHDAEHKVFTLAPPMAYPSTRFNQGFRILNSRHGLRKPGMWMYEKARKRVIYWPCEGETAENLDVSLSRAHAILSVAKATNVRVEGLVFEGCSAAPDHVNPYGATPNAAITMQDPRSVTIDGCEVRNCAAKGVFALKPERTLVTRTHVHHTGAECIDYFDGGNASDITWCEVHDAGLLGVSMGIGMQLSNCKCVGNKIHDIPACGVVMWSANSVFASNEVYRCMYGSRDGGGLYGGFSDCVLHDNYVHDIGGWPGLYADEGSQRDLYYNNRFENCFWPTHIHCAQYVTISNNVFKNDSPMRWSFQGSGHGVFCDNKIYTLAMPTNDAYRENCDFWGRNEFFVRGDDGSYKSAGVLTLARSRPKPATFDLPALMEKAVRPIDVKGNVWNDAYVKGMRWGGSTSVGSDGYSSVGVPDAGVYMCYDEYYLFVYVVRRWNALCGYPGVRNLTSTGWGHCDAARLSFEGGRTLTVFPDGTFDAVGFKPRIEKDDLVKQKDGTFMIRLALEDLAVKGAKTLQVKLDLEAEEDDLLLTDEAAEMARKPEKNLPKPVDAVGCSLKFNVTIWVEDLREEKSLFPRQGDDYATGTIRFAKAPEKLR